MRVAVRIITAWMLLFVACFSSAQCTDGQNACDRKVPRVMRFNGTLRDGDGKPRTGTLGIIFAVYAESSGGVPLWQETQNVRLGEQGRYQALLGATTSEGLPVELFSSKEPRWLAAQVLLPGEAEQPRVLLVSVPYALMAADAETLGGLPPSAFVKMPPLVSDPNTPGSTSQGAKSAQQGTAVAAVASPSGLAVTTPGGATDAIPKFSDSTTIVNSQIKESPNGEVTMTNLANILFADQFPDGVPGALAACPAEGCTIYAGSKNVSLNLGTIDPGKKLVTLYLGPFTYTVKQITLRNSLKIIGMGASIPGTILQSVNGNNPVFVLPQAAHVAASSVRLSGLHIVGSVGNTSEDAFFLDASNVIETGLWYSSFSDLFISNFAGVGIHMRGPTANFAAANQWITFENIVVFRTAGGGNALRIEGANFQLHFTNCEFDGQGMGDGTNIFIGGFPGGTFAFPFDITFRGLVSQTAAVAVQLDGVQTVTFHTSHHESLWGAYLITNDTGAGNRGVTITDSVFNPNVGVNNGAGYLLKVATTAASGIYFFHNRLGGAGSVSSPDAVVSGTNLAQVVYQDNQYLGSLDVPPTSGITSQLGATPSINIGGAHTIGLNTSTTPIVTIQSSLGPGETVAFLMLGGPVTFATGGNIALPGSNTVTVTGSITFIRSDLTGDQKWWPIAQWTASATQGGGTPATFTLSTSGSSSATVAAGETANYSLTLSPSGGFTGNVQFICQGGPAASTCSVAPNPVALNNNSPATASVAVTTSGTPNPRALPVSSRPRLPAFNHVAGSMIWQLILIPVGMWGQGRKQHRAKALLLAGLFLLIIPSLGCQAAAGTTGESGLPPRGTYSLVLTGVSGNIRQSITLTLRVL
jgi:hypothetical protein